MPKLSVLLCVVILGLAGIEGDSVTIDFAPLDPSGVGYWQNASNWQNDITGLNPDSPPGYGNIVNVAYPSWLQTSGPPFSTLLTSPNYTYYSDALYLADYATLGISGQIYTSSLCTDSTVSLVFSEGGCLFASGTCDPNNLLLIYAIITVEAGPGESILSTNTTDLSLFWGSANISGIFTVSASGYISVTESFDMVLSGATFTFSSPVSITYYAPLSFTNISSTVIFDSIHTDFSGKINLNNSGDSYLIAGNNLILNGSISGDADSSLTIKSNNIYVMAPIYAQSSIFLEADFVEFSDISAEGLVFLSSGPITKTNVGYTSGVVAQNITTNFGGSYTNINFIADVSSVIWFNGTFDGCIFDVTNSTVYFTGTFSNCGVHLVGGSAYFLSPPTNSGFDTIYGTSGVLSINGNLTSTNVSITNLSIINGTLITSSYANLVGNIQISAQSKLAVSGQSAYFGLDSTFQISGSGDVEITNGAYAIFNTGTIEVNRLILSGGKADFGSPVSAAIIQWNAGNISGLTVSPNTNFYVDGENLLFYSPLVNNGTLFLNGSLVAILGNANADGEISNFGNITTISSTSFISADINNYGILQIGGILSIQGDFLNYGASVIYMDYFSDSLYDQLIVNGTFGFGGSIFVTTSAKPTPSGVPLISFANDVNIPSSQQLISQAQSDQGYFTLDNTSLILKIATCGNGELESGEQCDGGICCGDTCQFASSSTLCANSSSSACTADSYCSGVNGSCLISPAADGTSCSLQDTPCQSESVCSSGVCVVPSAPCGSSGFCNTSLNLCECYDSNSSYPACSEANLTCPADGQCSGRGECTSGVCVCDDSSVSGPSCDQEIVPIFLAYNDTFPSVALQSTSSQSSQAFQVYLSGINEIGTGQQTVRSIDLSNVLFKLTQPYPLNPYIMQYETILPNKATFTIVLDLYTTKSVVNFADETQVIAPYTLKVTLTASSWPFLSALNSLELLLSVSPKNQSSIPSQSEEFNYETSPASSARAQNWLQISYGGVSLFSQYLTVGLVDEKVRPLTILHESNGVIATTRIISPFFNNELVVDPNFAMLLACDSSCGGSQQTGQSSNSILGGNRMVTIVVAVVVSIVGVVIIVVLIYFRFQTKARQKRSRQLTMRIAKVFASQPPEGGPPPPPAPAPASVAPPSSS